MSLRVVPVTFDQARAFVALHHRHHGVLVGFKLTAGVADGNDVLHGVAVAGGRWPACTTTAPPSR